MILALDFDDTYTKDPEMWDEFIKMAEKRGHEVICVTMRYPYEIEWVKDRFPKIKVISTHRKAKLWYLLTEGIIVDVWIDDSPNWIYQDG